MDQKETKIVNSVETLLEKIKEVREAQRIFSTYTQEQVDKIFFAASVAANQARIPLANSYSLSLWDRGSIFLF